MHLSEGLPEQLVSSPDQSQNALPTDTGTDKAGNWSQFQTMYIRWGRTSCPNDATVLYTGDAIFV
jgi:hypothetical protein